MSSHIQNFSSAAGPSVRHSIRSSSTHNPSQRSSFYREEVRLYSAEATQDFLPQLFQSYQDYKLTEQHIDNVVKRLQGDQVIKVLRKKVQWSDSLAPTSRRQGMDPDVCRRFDRLAKAISQAHQVSSRRQVPGRNQAPSRNQEQTRHQVQRHFVYLDQGNHQALPGTNEHFEAPFIPGLALVPEDVPLGASSNPHLIPSDYRNWSSFDVILETKVTNRANYIAEAKQQLLALVGAQPYRTFALGLAYYSAKLKVIRIDQCGFSESTEIDIAKLQGLKTAIQLLAWLTTVPPAALGVIPGTELEWTYGPMQLPKVRDTTITASCRDQHFRRFSRLVIDASFLPGFSQSVILSIDKVIVNRASAQGRGTRVWKVKVANRPLSASTHLSSSALILNISFQPALLDVTDNILPTAETKFHQDFPAFHSSVLTADPGMASDANLSIMETRGVRIPSDPTFKDKILSLNIVREAESLNTIDDPVVFLRAMVDIIHGVQAIYNQGFLHRDLSTSNVGCISDDGRNPRGVIFDFDMASDLKARTESRHNDNDQSMNSSAQKHTRTGTLPFMALGILGRQPEQHDLCHDLESIVWIFIVTLSHGALDSKGKRHYPSMIADMVYSSSRNDCRIAKYDMCFSQYETVT